MTTDTQDVDFEGWALVELMGHRKRAGLCKDVSMVGSRLLRVDVPDPKDIEKFTTEFYGGAAIYGLHPCDEATGRRLAIAHRYDRPIEPYEEPSRPALGYHPGEEEPSENEDNPIDSALNERG